MVLLAACGTTNNNAAPPSQTPTVAVAPTAVRCQPADNDQRARNAAQTDIQTAITIIAKGITGPYARGQLDPAHTTRAATTAAVDAANHAHALVIAAAKELTGDNLCERLSEPLSNVIQALGTLTSNLKRGNLAAIQGLSQSAAQLTATAHHYGLNL